MNETDPEKTRKWEVRHYVVVVNQLPEVCMQYRSTNPQE